MDLTNWYLKNQHLYADLHVEKFLHDLDLYMTLADVFVVVVMMFVLMMMIYRGRWWWQVTAAAVDEEDNDDDWYCLLSKMCDINSQSFTTKLQKRKWHIKTAVIYSAEYVRQCDRNVPCHIRSDKAYLLLFICFLWSN